MTPREENELLSTWSGLECRCKHYSAIDGTPCSGVYVPRESCYGNCPRHSNGGNPPDYDRDEVAVTLLPVMVGHGYVCQLDCSELGYRVKYALDDGYNCPWNYTAYFTTIAAAIKAACLQLIKGGA